MLIRCRSRFIPSSVRSGIRDREDVEAEVKFEREHEFCLVG